MGYIPYGRQSIAELDEQAVLDVLRSDWLTQGPSIEAFEKKVAEYCDVKYAVAVNSATSALHMAVAAAGLRDGKRLWTSPNTFVASANCALYCNADVDFVDIDDKTYNMDAALLEERLAQAKLGKGTLPDVVIPVHFSGQSCNMEQIGALAKEYGFTLIEDASHAVGGSYGEKKIGCCQYSDMAVFSFHPVKIVTTAEGGMVLTNSTDLYEKLQLLRSHGITRKPEQMQGDSHGPWYYQQVELGWNYRMTDMQAALGCSQMERIDAFIAKRREIAVRYNRELAGLPCRLPHQDAGGESAWHLYVIRVAAEKRRAIFEYLRQHEIGVNVHYIPVHTQPYYARLGFKQGDFPIAEAYYSECISLPVYYGLTEEEQAVVIQCVKEALLL